MPASVVDVVGAGPVLAVCAHPDDESFGLGALISALVDAGSPVGVVCFTHGEASTLSAGAGELAGVRAAELDAAAAVLGVEKTKLLGYPDGALVGVELDELAGHVVAMAAECRAGTLLVFDTGGVTGHPDHRRATMAAMDGAARSGLAVVAWAVPDTVAARLNAELGTSFVGRSAGELAGVVAVDRTRQLAAIAEHRSQSADNPVLRRRLELLGDVEALRCLRPPATARSASPPPTRTAP